MLASQSRSRPTMRDVAARAGVSLKTVSRVVNGEQPISPATAQRVSKAIEELGFLRNDLARSLRSKGGSQMIGLVIGDLANPFYSGMAKGLAEEASARGYMVVMGSSEEDAAQERTFIGALCARRVEGIVLVPAGRQHRYLLPEIEAGLRLVFVDRPPGRITADTILLDNRDASREATALLAAEGHTRIGVISDTADVYALAERVKGYRDALEECGLAPDPAYERIGTHTAESAFEATVDLLGSARPTALFCTNNRAAIGAVRAVVGARAHVEVIGFDDFELADLLPIRIRVIRHDPVELGRRAGVALFSRIEGDTRAARRTVVRSELLWRGLAGL